MKLRATLLLLASLRCVSQDCGIPPIKPIPPIGCKDVTAQCVCDAKGACHWEWVCVPGEKARIVDRKFLAASAFAISATLADSYSTAKLGANYRYWLTWRSTAAQSVFPGSPCTIEAGSPFLYGTHPTTARAWGVGVGKIATAEISAALLRRNRKLHRLWSLPLLFIGADSAHGAIYNASHC